MFSKLLVLRAGSATHCFHHVLVQLHGWWKELGVSTQDVAKVNMDEMACFREQEVVKMSVPHTKEIGYDTVASCTRKREALN